ncbi:MAG TPA: NAD(P)-binding domain-containing protein [Solirubrobacteraceae bacterium]|jgi:predicted dinucleotide-binding enzyme|nr:NAD(P)-binding domain-containing protein [Solirubrobacteraceae bacterium]
MPTAIIGIGNLGGTVARHLVGGGESVVLAAKDELHAKALAEELGPNASAASVDDAVAGADVVVLATWLDQTRELVPARTRLFEDKVVIDPSNPIGFDENGQMLRTLPERQSSGSVVVGLLPTSAHYVKAFGTLGAVEQLATGANHEPRIVLFYVTDDDVAEATAQRLIRVAGFEPLRVGGVSDAGRIEGPDGDLQGRILDLDEARAAIETTSHHSRPKE